MYDRDDSAPALLSFLIGGIIGASVTCLLAPQTGIVLRRRIRDGVDDRARKGKAAAQRLAQAGRALAGEASEALIGEGVASPPGTEGARASTSSTRNVPEPGLPTDMGRGGRG